MFFFLPTTQPQTNLATEEWLLQKIEHIGPTLLLYVNSACVVMGKHQNPLLECKPNFLEKNRIPLLRRFTGGGTVFHDLGNLNFSFLMPKTMYNEPLHFIVIQSALAGLGIDSTIDPHKSLWHNDRKFSGSAFARKLIGNIHHGTLLIKSDLDLLNQTLAPENADLQTKAPRSRRAPVINLSEAQPNLTVPVAVQAISEQFSRHFGNDAKSPLPFWNENDLRDIVEKHCSMEWVFGNTPQY